MVDGSWLMVHRNQQSTISNQQAAFIFSLNWGKEVRKRRPIWSA